MNHSKFILIVVIVLVVLISVVFFVSPPIEKTKVAPKHIIALTSSDLQLSGMDGIKVGLKELGYKDEDLIIDVLNPKGDRELIKTMAEDAVAKKPDLIISLSTSASSAMKDADKDAKLPMVFTDVGNFKELGIEDIQHPGGFMTGVVADNVPLGPKRMEILKELNPQLKSVGLLVNNKHVSYDEILRTHEAGAKKLGIKLLWYPVTKKEEVTPAMERLLRNRPDAFMTTSEATISGNAPLIAPLLRKAKIPSIDFNVERGVSAGYLMIYGVARFDTGKQSARLVEKVLKGEKPGNLPIEFASNLTFEINNALAREFRIKVPDSLLLRANKVYNE